MSKLETPAVELAHAISGLTPKYIGSDTQIINLKTLVHEMAHLWHKQYGKSRGAHGREWQQKMMEIGLLPIRGQIAEFGLIEVGQVISGEDLIIEGGPFAKACADFIKEFSQSNTGGLPTCQTARKDTRKNRLLCPNCGKTHGLITGEQ
ncbi:SprT-like domain-containing protein [Desulfovibrio sp. OttesenSCG-928-G11]|nr:SprT-like domain-containing protein [Desulfovibrio sp. OttesenSCG-928-G11]